MSEWISLLKSMPQQQDELIPYLRGTPNLSDFILTDYPKLSDELKREIERNLTTRKGARFLDFLQNHNNPVIRRWGLTLTGLLPAELQIPRLCAALSDKDEENKLVAAQSLGKLQSLEVVEILITGLMIGKWLPARIVQALLAIGPLAIPKITVLAQSPDANLRLSAIEILEQFAGATAGKTIASLLNDPNPRVRKKAAGALGSFSTYADVLINSLAREQDISVKVQLIRTIAKLNISSACQLLQAEANSQDLQVAKTARAALQSIKSSGSVLEYGADNPELFGKDISQF